MSMLSPYVAPVGYVNAKDAAKLSGVHQRTVSHILSEGKVSSVKRGRCRYIAVRRMEELKAVAAERRRRVGRDK